MERRLRILFLATYFPKPGNPLMGVWALRQAKAFQAAGMDVRVVSFSSYVPRILGKLGFGKGWALCPADHDWSGVRVEYPKWPFYQFGLAKRFARRNPRPSLDFAWLARGAYLKRIVRDWRPDVVYCHHTAVNGYLGLRLNKALGIPFVVTDWDFGEIADCESYPKRREMYDAVTRAAARMISLSTRMRDTMSRLFSAAKVSIVPNGADPIPSRLFTTPRPRELEGKTIVFAASIFYTRKGVPLLIRAFSRIAERHPRAVLRIVGDGEERPLVEAAIRETNMADRVQLLGFQPHDQVLQEMAWCDFFALPGWDEPLATVFLEAMSAGKPIVYATDGGINDFVESGVHGVGVEPKNEDAIFRALDELLSSESRRREMGRAARDRFESALTWEVNANRMRTIFEEAAGTPDSP